MSMITTSGVMRSACAMASRPSPAVATTCMSGCALRIMRRPSRTVSWSSARRIRSLAAMGLAASTNLHRNTFPPPGVGKNLWRETGIMCRRAARYCRVLGEFHMRFHVLMALMLVASVACSNPDRGRRASVAGPSAASIDATPMGVGGISGPMDVLFPSRADSFDFRNQLETKYQTGLNRAPSQTYVDREGEVVWVQEYIRYRVNGCDHATAVARVMAQIDGCAPGGICAENRDSLSLLPPRNESLDFRRQLEEKYRAMGRPLQSTYVDAEGSVIWTQEYLRYRVNDCDHAVSVQKVFQQIDGGAVSDTCVPSCLYRVQPGVNRFNDGQHTSFVDLIGDPGGCAWTAASSAPWLTFSSAYNSGTK